MGSHNEFGHTAFTDQERLSIQKSLEKLLGPDQLSLRDVDRNGTMQLFMVFLG